jgi:hypothetical protein
VIFSQRLGLWSIFLSIFVGGAISTLRRFGVFLLPFVGNMGLFRPKEGFDWRFGAILLKPGTGIARKLLIGMGRCGLGRYWNIECRENLQ